jgi:hypothetical protein
MRKRVQRRTRGARQADIPRLPGDTPHERRLVECGLSAADYNFFYSEEKTSCCVVGDAAVELEEDEEAVRDVGRGGLEDRV